MRASKQYVGGSLDGPLLYNNGFIKPFYYGDKSVDIMGKAGDNVWQNHPQPKPH